MQAKLCVEAEQTQCKKYLEFTDSHNS